MPIFATRDWRRITRSRNRSRGLLRHGKALAIIPDMEREPYAWEIKSTEWYVVIQYHEWNSIDGIYEVTNETEVVLNVVNGAVGSYDGAKYNAEKAKGSLPSAPEEPYTSVSRPKYRSEYDYERPTRWRGEVKPEKKFKNDIEVED